MSQKLEVSFNSPQCGWMAIGFDDGTKEFHTTTAHAPHSKILSELLTTLTTIAEENNTDFSRTLKWNRDPEEFDFNFTRNKNNASIEIIEYPTGKRESTKGETVYSYTGDAKQIAKAFYVTFQQLFDERDIDEFEENWHQKFPREEFEKFSRVIEGE